MTNAHNARLLCANGPLIHYARRLESELEVNDAGSTTCNIQYYVGRAPLCLYSLVQAVVVDDPVTCVICAIDYVVWP